MIRIKRPKPTTLLSKIRTWFFGFFSPTRESWTIIMPSGREIKMSFDNEHVEVDLGKAEEFGIKESFEMVGKELRRSFKQVQEEIDAEASAKEKD